MIRKLSLLYVLSGWVALTACGGGSGGGGSSGTTSCSTNADCGQGSVCDFSGSGTTSAALPGLRTAAVDAECYQDCEGACLAAGVPAPTCTNDCTNLCSDGMMPPVPGDPTEPSDPGGPSNPADPGEPSDPGDPSGEPQPRQGVCRVVDVGGSGGADGSGGSEGSGGSDSGTGGSGSEDPAVEWAGNWNVDLSYTANCDNFGNLSSKNQSHSLTVQLSGGNDALTLTTGNHQMAGFGSNSGLTLNGTFPVRTTSDKDANTMKDDTKITIKLTSVQSASSASGTIEGTYYASGFSAKCTVQDGTATFSR